MVRIFKSVATVILASGILLSGCSQDSQKPSAKAPSLPNSQSASGDVLFKRYCSSCHPNGGNVSDPDRPLFASALKRNHINGPDDIVRVMRHPISRMIRFDTSTLSDSDAQAIAEYVLINFK